jgi:hypothetical protein
MPKKLTGKRYRSDGAVPFLFFAVQGPSFKTSDPVSISRKASGIAQAN